jgi:RNA polymerase sigma-70 factor (ECF subfamily)
MAEAPHTTPNDAANSNATPHAQTVSRLFREHNQALIQFLLTRVRSEQEARDVAQEAYVRMLELERPSGVSFLRAYLFKTAANLAVDRARRQTNLQHIHEQWIDPFESLAQAPAADHNANAQQELALVCTYLQELPPRCRTAFYLHRFRDLSAAEIAQRLGVSDRMVRSYLVQALVHCRQRLNAARGETNTTPAAPDDLETNP